MEVKKKHARILFLLYISAVLFLCFSDFSGVSEAPVQFLGFDADKVVHFLMFLPFPLLFYFSFRPAAGKAWHSLLIALGILLIGSIIAASTEIVQDFLPYRESDIADFMADFIALCCSSAAILVIDLIKSSRHA